MLSLRFVHYDRSLSASLTPCQPASNVILKSMRPSIWLSTLMLLWGIVMTLHGVLHGYGGLIGSVTTPAKRRRCLLMPLRRSSVFTRFLREWPLSRDCLLHFLASSLRLLYTDAGTHHSLVGTNDRNWEQGWRYSFPLLPLRGHSVCIVVLSPDENLISAFKRWTTGSRNIKHGWGWRQARMGLDIHLRGLGYRCLRDIRILDCARLS
jgi:hypothetical protein